MTPVKIVPQKTIIPHHCVSDEVQNEIDDEMYILLLSIDRIMWVMAV
jgi:hypothetical protein